MVVLVMVVPVSRGHRLFVRVDVEDTRCWWQACSGWCACGGWGMSSTDEVFVQDGFERHVTDVRLALSARVVGAHLRTPLVDFVECVR